jgi:hypothetical protein
MNNNVQTIYKLQVVRDESWTPVFIIAHLQVVAHLHNSHVWILEQAIMIPNSPTIVILASSGQSFLVTNLHLPY